MSMSSNTNNSTGDNANRTKKLKQKTKRANEKKGATDQ